MYENDSKALLPNWMTTKTWMINSALENTDFFDAAVSIWKPSLQHWCFPSELTIMVQFWQSSSTFQNLAAEGITLTGSYAVSHPSQVRYAHLVAANSRDLKTNARFIFVIIIIHWSIILPSQTTYPLSRDIPLGLETTSTSHRVIFQRWLISSKQKIFRGPVIKRICPSLVADRRHVGYTQS